MSSNIVRFNAIINVARSAVTGSYTTFGSAFAHAMRVLHFTNDSNATFMLSFDGSTDNIILLPDGFVLYDLTSDQDSNETFRYEKGSQLWIKALEAGSDVVGQTNAVYCSLVYGKGE